MRTRSLLIDNDEGRVYSNQDNEYLLISGLLLRTQRYDDYYTNEIQDLSAGYRTEFYFPNDTVFKRMTLSTATEPKNTKITITPTFKAPGTSVYVSDNTNFIWSTDINNTNKTQVFSYSKILTAGYSMQFSIDVQFITRISGAYGLVGIPGSSTGKGLSVIFEYYLG